MVQRHPRDHSQKAWRCLMTHLPDISHCRMNIRHTDLQQKPWIWWHDARLDHHRLTRQWNVHKIEWNEPKESSCFRCEFKVAATVGVDSKEHRCHNSTNYEFQKSRGGDSKYRYISDACLRFDSSGHVIHKKSADLGGGTCSNTLVWHNSNTLHNCRAWILQTFQAPAMLTILLPDSLAALCALITTIIIIIIIIFDYTFQHMC